jgi:cytochrome c heme-lyase
VQSALYGSSPFDRHDWVVDRCGTDVRYIIDFYTGHVPEKDGDRVVPIHIDARPAALDSFANLVDVLRKTVFGLK